MSRLSCSRILIWLGGLLMVVAAGVVAVDGLASWQRQVETTAAGVVSRGERLEAVGELAPMPEGGPGGVPDETTMPPLPRFELVPTAAPSVPEPAPTATPLPIAVPTPAAAATVEPTPAATAEPTPAATAEPTPAATPEPVAEPTPEEVVSYGPAVWVTIPRIKVDERVMEVGVENGEYVAPAWDIGHQEDSVNPGEPGNSVFNGHLTTINAGHVFARLHELRPADVIYVFTRTHRLTWTVEQVYTTDNDDSSFIAPTPDTRITLYTCDGHLIPLQHDYSDRFVVVGRLQEARARGGATAAATTEGG